MLRYGFFDSEITGYDEEGMPIFDRAESSDFLAMFISKIITDGVLALPGDCFQVVAYEGMKVKVRPGFGIVRGRFAADDKEFEIEIPNAPTAYKRVDRVILRANYLKRLCEIVVRQGTPDATPLPPALIRPEAGDYYELSLALVSVNANQTVITQSHITDTRLDRSVCGVVTQAIDHLDTSVFYDQLSAFYKEYVEKFDDDYADFMGRMKEFEIISEQAFNTWFESIKGKLDGDVAARMMVMIDELSEAVKNKLDKDGDSKDNTITFESEDTEEDESADEHESAVSVYPEKWTHMPLLESKKPHSILFNRISIVFKNLRYLGKLIGGTDISAIGDGTVTGALSVLNSNKGFKYFEIILSNYFSLAAGAATTVYDIENYLLDGITLEQVVDVRPYISYTTNTQFVICNAMYNTTSKRWYVRCANVGSGAVSEAVLSARVFYSPKTIV